MSTGIQWTDETWNPVTGCNKVSPGCANCYAEGVADRFWASQYPPVTDLPVDGFRVASSRPREFTDVMAHPDRLDKPLRWTKPRRVFVNSMSDLFHDDVPDEFIAAVFAVMARAPSHTFQILTKRPARMRAWFQWANALPSQGVPQDGAPVLGYLFEHLLRIARINGFAQGEFPTWPLPNVHLGVSVEDQQRADERVPILLDTPAAVRWVSAEPLLGPVDFTDLHSDDPQRPAMCRDGLTGDEVECFYGDRTSDLPGLDWIVVGGESGPGARPCDVAWVRQIVAACQGASVPVFVKQLGSRPGLRAKTRASGRTFNDLYTRDQGMWPEELADEACVTHAKGGDPDEWPADLRVREMPTTPPETTT